MRLSEWRALREGLAGGEHWARNIAGDAIERLAPGDDPEVFGRVAVQWLPNRPPDTDVRIWAAASIGLVAVDAGSDQAQNKGQLKAVVTSWDAVGHIRLETSGPVDDPRRLTSKLTLGDESIESDRANREELEAFYRACAVQRRRT